MNADLDPATPDAFIAAVRWLDGTLLGSLASIVAIIAVATIGLLLISGRVDVRRAVQVILGCFIIFGASTIAAGLADALNMSKTGGEVLPPQPPAMKIAPPGPQRPVANVPYDPYAGAALPPR